MILEKIKLLIETLEVESQEKLFVRELKRSTLTQILSGLQVNHKKYDFCNKKQKNNQEIYEDFSKSDLASKYAASEDLHIYYRRKYEEAIKAVLLFDFRLK